MRWNVTLLLASTAALTTFAGSVQARSHHSHGHSAYTASRRVPALSAGLGSDVMRGHAVSQEVLGSSQYNPYADYEGPGSIVLNLTEKARREPGVTFELAPDAKETATGGPVGGVPGFDGT